MSVGCYLCKKKVRRQLKLNKPNTDIGSLEDIIMSDVFCFMKSCTELWIE